MKKSFIELVLNEANFYQYHFLKLRILITRDPA
jgi:hypothetical protein